MKMNQKGAIDMMFVVLLVVLIAVGGFVAWRVTSVDQSVSDSAENTVNASESTANVNENLETATPADSDTSEETETETIPSDWVQFSDATSGLSFAYPAAWGDASVTPSNPNEEGMEFNGNHADIRFSQADISGTVTSSDYEYLGFGKGAAAWSLFTGEIATFADQVNELPDSNVLLNTATATVTATADCAFSGASAIGTYSIPDQNDTYDLLRIGFYAETGAVDIPCDTVGEDAVDYLNATNLDALVEIADYL